MIAPMRSALVVMLLLVAAGGCKKDPRDEPGARTAEPASATEDAGAVVGPDRRFDIESLDDLAPKGPAPAAIVIEVARGDCSTDYAPRPARDQSPMCKVEGGSFMMGPPDGAGDEAPRAVEVGSFHIDQHEVTVAQYAHFLTALGSNDACPDSYRGLCVDYQDHPEFFRQMTITASGAVPLDGMAAHPIVQVSAEGMLKYCRWVGKRMPSEAEWEYAARHDPQSGKDLRFPWGDAFEPGRANCWEELCADGHEMLGPVGSDWGAGVGAGASPWGAVDMAGNAIEKVLTCQDPMTLATCAPQERGGDHGARIPRNISMAWPIGHPHLDGTMVTGFRCLRPW